MPTKVAKGERQVRIPMRTASDGVGLTCCKIQLEDIECHMVNVVDILRSEMDSFYEAATIIHQQNA